MPWYPDSGVNTLLIYLHGGSGKWPTDATMDVNERLRAAKEEAAQREAEAKARYEQRERSEAAHHAWERAAGMTRRCYAHPDSTPEAVEAIVFAIHQSQQAGELPAVRRLCDFYLEHHEKLIPGVHVAATIVNVCELDSAAQMLRDAIDARILESVADAIAGIGEIVWHGFDLKVYYANLLPKESLPAAKEMVAPIVPEPAVPEATRTEAVASRQSHIRVDLEKSRVWIGNASYEVKPDGAELVQALVEADGVPINASDVVAKTTRVIARLPKEVRELIETSKGKGTYIPRDKLYS